MALVVDAATAAHERTKRPEACGTAAKAVLALWRCLGTPSPAELAEQIALVAVWARTSTDSLAENDIRGTRPNGERWGTDRSRDLSTLCVQDRWDARLTAAEAWHARGRTDAAPPSLRRAGERPGADRANAPLRRGDLFLVPAPLDAHEGAIDTPFEAL